MMNIHQEWNSNNNTFVDVSSFLLFECTGDSEFDSSYFYNKNNSSTSDDDLSSLITLNQNSHQRFLEDDDAQSCSYEYGDDHVEDHEDMELDHFQIDNNDDDNDNDDDDDDDEDLYNRSCCSPSDMEEDDEDGTVVEQRWMNKKSKSNVSSVVDSEFKSQKDKDKLFWETCLAS